MSDDKIDILLQYQNISNRLKKKRILKKLNVAEAGQQFENLGKFCEREDLEQYAGLSYQAAAKCQNSLGNHLEEAFLLLKSSKQYLRSYLKSLENNSVPNETYFNYSETNYKECLARLQDGKDHSDLVKDMISSGITLEMGHTINKRIGSVEKAHLEFERALKFLSKSPVEKIICLEKLVDCYIELGNYNECLKAIDEITKEGVHLPDSGLKNNTLKNAEITKILLLLILQPTPQQISQAAASTLEKYAWVETSEPGEIKDLQTTLDSQGLSMLGENLFLRLQSLVMACQYSDLDALTCQEADLGTFLNREQRTLLKTLIKQYIS